MPASNNANEANSVLGTARGNTTFYDSNNYSNVTILNFSSSTTNRTSASRPEAIQYLFSISGNNAPARGNTSTIDYGSLAPTVAITYQTVEG